MKKSKTEFYRDAGYIVDTLNKLAKINVLENRRTRDLSEARSVLYTVFRSKYDVTLKTIRDCMKEFGKSSDHATILYSIKNFEIYARFSDLELKEWRDKLIYKIDTNTLR